MTAPRFVLTALVAAGLLSSACGPGPFQRLCEAIAKRDVVAVRQVFAEHELDPLQRQGGCLPAEAVFTAAGPKDADLASIGIELLKAGLPADASWHPTAGGSPVTAIEVAAGKGNVELVRGLFAVALDPKTPAVGRALIRAAEGGHLPVVALLLEEGVALDTTDGGQRAIDRAEFHGHEEVVRLLAETAVARAALEAAAAAEGEAKAKAKP